MKEKDIPFVVVSGVPGSGKTSLSKVLAPSIDLPMIDKDDILEGLFEALGIGDTDWRQRLSRASDEILQRLARSSSGAVLTSFWRNRQMSPTSGTPTDWITRTTDRVVEVYCMCDPVIAAERFLNRSRHPGHLDSEKNIEEIVANSRILAAMGHLGIGRLLQVDTSGEVDFNAVIGEVKILLGRPQ